MTIIIAKKTILNKASLDVPFHPGTHLVSVHHISLKLPHQAQAQAIHSQVYRKF